jgi:spore coat polysaccharide biosynthesis protein SpsF (cytidylyltransferase family)
MSVISNIQAIKLIQARDRAERLAEKVLRELNNKQKTEV